MRSHKFFCFGIALLCSSAHAAKIEIPGPLGSSKFGAAVAIVKHGNIVVADPGWPDGKYWGAVRMYSPDGALLSSLNGTAELRVGHGGIFVLGNGNFVVLSTGADFQNCSFNLLGAATWVDVDVGLPATLTASNSLVCMNADEPDEIKAISLHNGNFVVQSDFEAAWGSAEDGLQTGVATTANSFRTIPDTSIKPLQNGNFVVISPGWSPGGAVTLGNGLTGLTGTPSASNSLVGATNLDIIGSGGITELTNGDFVVSSPYWDNAGQTNAGAVTWVDGVTGLAATVSASNSLVGATQDDRVGEVVVALANGNYVVVSRDWDDWTTATPRIGAVTWGNGSQAGGTKGIVSPANSLIGVLNKFTAGSRGVKPLSNGNYVVQSGGYLSSFDPGAATWANGAAPLAGAIGPGNSLIGSSSYISATPLTNGNFVFADAEWKKPDWINDDDKPPLAQSRVVGAVMLVDGTIGAVGSIDPARSLLGNGYGIPGRGGGSMEGVTALSDGNYAVCTIDFQVDGKAATPKSVGSVTWQDGFVGVGGVVSAANSITGSKSYDQICYVNLQPYNSILPLPGGDYLIRSPYWGNAGNTKAGAVTWVAGGGTQTGVVSSANSLVGASINERIGANDRPLLMLGSTDYVLSNPQWTDGGTLPAAGSVTLGRVDGSITGEITSTNSLVGINANDGVGSGGVIGLGGPYYLIRSPFWHDAAGVAYGAMTLASADFDLAGPLPSDRTVFGSVANQGTTMVYAFDEGSTQLVIGEPSANKVIFLDTGLPELLRDGFED